MIKVTVRDKVFTEDGTYKEAEKIKEHKNGEKAFVFNGILTIFNNAANANNDFSNAIAGYESSTWLDWVKE